jgi:hypothetical protein
VAWPRPSAPLESQVAPGVAMLFAKPQEAWPREKGLLRVEPVRGVAMKM